MYATNIMNVKHKIIELLLLLRRAGANGTYCLDQIIFLNQLYQQWGGKS